MPGLRQRGGPFRRGPSQGITAAGHVARLACRAAADGGAGPPLRGGIDGAPPRALSQLIRIACLARGIELRIAKSGRTRPPGGAIVRTVFFDVDTQIDFLYPAGALY